MTNFDLKDYQNKAVDEMTTKCEVLLQTSTTGSKQKFVLMAPTGSGKTIVCGKFLKEWDDKTDFNCAFTWIAPNRLHDQSKDKLIKLYDVIGKTLTPLDYEQLTGNQIHKNEIFFVNWERIFRTNNNIRIGSENGKNLSTIVNNTKDHDLKIILIIDEGHDTAGGDQSQKVIEIIQPDLVIYVTATPGVLLVSCDDFTKIKLDDVKAAGMITKSIFFNHEVLKTASLDKKDVIKIGLDQRKKLLDAFTKEKTKGKPVVNPLLLIQLPRRSPAQDDLRDEIEKILRDNHKITTQNGKLAIYLSDDGKSAKKNKVNLDGIDDTNNKVEVMIFKEAIALGWDCPRASILCLFRDLENETFGIQVLGRIMRMPELKHYNTDLLNHAYVFGNFEKIKLHEDIQGMVEQDFSYRNKELWESCPITLQRYSLSNKQKKPEITSIEFNKIFNKKEIQDKFKTIKTKEYRKMKQIVLNETEVDDIDKIVNAISGTTSEHDSTSEQISEWFEKIMISLTKGFSPNQSHHAIRNAIYKSLKKHFSLDITKDESKIQEIITSPDNLKIIKNCINDATDQYRTKFPTKKTQSINNPIPWEIPESDEHRDRNTIKSNPKSIMEPFFEENCNNLEKAFIKELTSSNKCKWWYKNKSSGYNAFAVIYDKSDEKHEFFVDFIVKFNDGQIGLYDTKGQGELDKEITKHKAKALADYILNENKTRKKNKLLGGIVANTSLDYTGVWKYNKDGKQSFDNTKISSWETLDNL